MTTLAVDIGPLEDISLDQLHHGAIDTPVVDACEVSIASRREALTRLERRLGSL